MNENIENTENEDMSNDDMNNEEFAKMLDEHEKKSTQSHAITSGILVKLDDKFAYIDIGRKKEARINIEEFQDKDENVLCKVDDKIEFVFVDGVASYKKAEGVRKIQAFIKVVSNNEIEDNLIEVVIKRKIQSGFIVAYEDMSFFMPMSLAFLKRDGEYIGSRFIVKIIKCDTEQFNIIVSRKDYLTIKREKFQKLVEGINVGDIIDATITKLSDYTVILDVNGVNGVIKFNEISHKGNINPNRIYKVGDVIKAKVLEVEVKRESLILSSKQAKENPWDKIDEAYKVGDIVPARVLSMKEYGIFVALDDEIDGFVHISELSWNKEKKAPSDFVEVDKSYDFKILEIKQESKNIKLSLRETQEKPIDIFAKLYKVNDIIDGEVVSIKDFGAFVKIDFLDGILPNSKSSWDKSKRCSDLFKVGETIKVKIFDIDTKKSKVILDKKALMESPVTIFKRQNKVNDIIKGPIKSVVDFGLFIDIGVGIDVFIPKAELYPKNPEDYNKGDEVEAILTRISDKISASINKLEKTRERRELDESMKEFNNDDDGFTMMDAVVRKTNRK